MPDEAQPTATTPPPAPAPAPAPAPPSEPVATQTPSATPAPVGDKTEAVRKAASILANRIISPPPKKKAEPAPTDPPPAKKPDEPAPAATPPATPSATTPPKKKDKPAPKEREDLTPERIAEISATTAAAVLKQQRREEPSPTTPPPQNVIELPEEFERDRAIFERLEKAEPRKYGGLISKLSDYAQKESDYIESWTRDNPGQEFDAEAPDHNDFYRKNQPKIDPADVDRIKESITEEKMRTRILSELEPELNEIRQTRVRQAIGPKVKQAMSGVFEDILAGINPEYVEHAGNAEKLNEIGKKDPIANDVSFMISNEFLPLAAEAVALHSGAPFDPKNPLHNSLYSMAVEMEDAVRQLPPSQQIHDGRQFATREEYRAMTQRERDHHWIINEEALVFAIKQKAKAKAEAVYTAEKGRHERYFKTLNGSSGSNSTQTPPPQSQTTPPRSAAPTVTAAPAVTTGNANGSGAPVRGFQRFLDRFGVK